MAISNERVSCKEFFNSPRQYWVKTSRERYKSKGSFGLKIFCLHSHQKHQETKTFLLLKPKREPVCETKSLQKYRSAEKKHKGDHSGKMKIFEEKVSQYRK